MNPRALVTLEYLGLVWDCVIYGCQCHQVSCESYLDHWVQ